MGGAGGEAEVDRVQVESLGASGAVDQGSASQAALKAFLASTKVITIVGTFARSVAVFTRSEHVPFSARGTDGLRSTCWANGRAFNADCSQVVVVTVLRNASPGTDEHSSVNSSVARKAQLESIAGQAVVGTGSALQS